MKSYVVFLQQDGGERDPGWYYEINDLVYGPYHSDWDAIAAAERAVKFDSEEDQ